jgi:Na+/H+ antiporter NhaD/arsenite permease-like protein
MNPIALLILVVVLIPPVWKILKRLGLNPAWALLSIIPFANIIGLWLMAFGKWPKDGNV